MNEKNVLCIVGPTACGKTALSVELALALSGEIVSADAVSVYRELNIGSAKPTLEERKGVPHHMIDCASISDDGFTVSVFREMARAAIDDILARGKLPIVVGGSGLYADAIFTDMRFSAPSDPLIRAAIEKEYDQDQNAVFEALRDVDAVAASRLHPNDKKRVVRALEVYHVTGQPFSALNRSFESAQTDDGTYHTYRIGLNTDRQTLYNRIETRVDRMIAEGLIEEAFALYKKGFVPETCRAMQSIGYAQLYDYYLGKCTLKETIDRIKLDTRHFAKRQTTWFKRNRETVWYDPAQTSAERIIQSITEYIHGDQ